MTPSTIARIARLYVERIGYDPIAEGLAPDFALRALHYNRESEIIVSGESLDGETGFAGATLSELLEESDDLADHRRLYKALTRAGEATHNNYALFA